MKGEKNWYALYTKPRWEKKIDAQLIKKGITSWCPVQKIERQWTDRKKIIDDPLFKSYVFVYIDIANKLDVLLTDGVLNFVHFLGKPAMINENEILLIQKYLSETDAKISVISSEGFKEQMKVKVSHGLFMNNVGTVVKGGKKRVYVQLESLGQVMIVEFANEHLTPEGI